jgi:hypothetical protein
VGTIEKRRDGEINSLGVHAGAIKQSDDQSGRRILLTATVRALVTLWMGLALTEPAWASGGGASSGHAAEGEHKAAAPYDPTQPRPLDLGVFDLRNFRPTHNEIANIRFSLHVVFKPGTSDATIAELAHWKQRLRDQAITAMRLADPSDLADPGLTRVQRMMLLRIKRLPLPEPVIGVYLTDFAVTSG